MSINETGIKEFLKEDSSFSYELKIGAYLESRRMHVEQSGHYIDPFTGKMRQFDIRAENTGKQIVVEGESGHQKVIFNRIQLNIECKKLSPLRPLLVLCSHGVLEDISFLSATKNGQENITINDCFFPHSFTQRLVSVFGDEFLEYIGMSTTQVETKNTGENRLEIVKSSKRDSESFYNKWTQSICSALSSANDIMINLRDENFLGYQYIWTPSILVIPDNTLWITCYADENDITSCRKTDGIKYKVAVDNMKLKDFDQTISIQNFFIFTETGLNKFLDIILSNQD